MKKSIITLGLVLSTITTSFAATTASITLKGVIAQKLDIAITSESAATNLPLTANQTDLKVGTATEISNAANGFKITATSTNAGRLKHSSGNAYFGYTMKYGGQQLNLANGSDSISTNGAVNRTRDISVSYQADQAGLLAGNYEDVVTFSITAN